MIDVSEHQRTIDWPAVHAAGQDRAYIKLLEHVEDPYAQRNLTAARKAGMQVGVYFFAHPSEAPHAAARRFLRAAEPHLVPGDIPPALDLELTEGHDWKYLNDWKAEWFAAVDHAVGCKAVFYSYYSFWKQMSLYHDRPVWGAKLGSRPADTNRTWTFWQHSFTGREAGIQGYVDLSTVLKPDFTVIPA